MSSPLADCGAEGGRAGFGGGKCGKGELTPSCGGYTGDSGRDGAGETGATEGTKGGNGGVCRAGGSSIVGNRGGDGSDTWGGGGSCGPGDSAGAAGVTLGIGREGGDGGDGGVPGVADGGSEGSGSKGGSGCSRGGMSGDGGGGGTSIGASSNRQRVSAALSSIVTQASATSCARWTELDAPVGQSSNRQLASAASPMLVFVSVSPPRYIICSRWQPSGRLRLAVVLSDPGERVKLCSAAPLK